MTTDCTPATPDTSTHPRTTGDADSPDASTNPRIAGEADSPDASTNPRIAGEADTPDASNAGEPTDASTIEDPSEPSTIGDPTDALTIGDPGDDSVPGTVRRPGDSSSSGHTVGVRRAFRGKARRTVSDALHEVAGPEGDAEEMDPRMRPDSIRVVEGDDHPVVLVGVVHDHPASVHRAAAVVDAVDPETVAVELPDLLVPVVGEDDVTGEGVGGEMAAAAAVTDGSVVGIDVPGRGSVRAALAELRDRRPTPRAALGALRDVGRIATNAALGRLSAWGVPGLPAVEALEAGHDYDCPADAPPAAQADHERAHLRRSTTLLRSFEPPAATTLLDAVRERYMVKRLRALRRDGPVVAVVGYGHLSPVETALKNEFG